MKIVPMTRQEFSDVTGVPRQRLERWEHEGLLVPDISRIIRRRGFKRLYWPSQIPEAVKILKRELRVKPVHIKRFPEVQGELRLGQ